jgi:hypothetical protein
MSGKIVCAFSQLAMGKDTLCDHLVSILPKQENWKRNAFANAVKDTFCTAFGVTREFIEEWKRKNECPEGMLMPIRQGLQFIGDGFRQIVPSIWIDIALRSDDNTIISDGRYLNEARAVRKKEGLNVLIYRKGFINNDPNPSESQLKPILEYCDSVNMEEGPLNFYRHKDYPEGLELFDYYIINDGDRKSFLEKVERELFPFVSTYF